MGKPNAAEVLRLSTESCLPDAYFEIDGRGASADGGGAPVAMHLQFSPRSAVLCGTGVSAGSATVAFCLRSEGLGAEADQLLYRTASQGREKELKFSTWGAGACDDDSEQCPFLKVKLKGAK